MDLMRIHHLNEYNAVVVAQSKGQSLTAFIAQRKEPRLCALLGNGSVGESADTPTAGDGAGAPTVLLLKKKGCVARNISEI